MIEKILYLCDGEKKCCESETCYKNGGECRNTRDLEHAENFRREKYIEGPFITYVEENILSDVEKAFLIDCIITAAEEDYYIHRRHIKKYNGLTDEGISRIMTKLGSSEEEIKMVETM